MGYRVLTNPHPLWFSCLNRRPRWRSLQSPRPKQIPRTMSGLHKCQCGSDTQHMDFLNSSNLPKSDSVGLVGDLLVQWNNIIFHLWLVVWNIF